MNLSRLLILGVAIAFLGRTPAGSAAPTSPVPSAVLPTPPQVFLDTTYTPPAGPTISVPAGGDFQAALNAAQPGSVIVLQAGATYSGTFTLPNKTGAGWIYIQSSALVSLPPPGTRVTPAQASLMPKVVSPNTRSTIITDAGAHRYRFVGVEITTAWASQSNTDYNVILLEAPGGNTSLGQVPTDIVFDRCYIHGTTTGNVRRGIAMNSARTAVIDSYLSEFHEVRADNQAIAAWNGPGPFKIVNNFLEAAGENVIFGGADPQIANLVPSDIEIRGNYFFKPVSWRVGDPNYAGIHWSVKNLLEFKNAQRVLVDGNVFEHNWPDAQNGFSILFTVRNQDGTAPWSVVQDVTFTHNIVQHVGSGVNILGYDDITKNNSQQTKRVLIQDDLFVDVSNTWGDGRPLQVENGAANIVFDHNDVFATDTYLIAGSGTPAHLIAATGFIFTNNITPNSGLGVGGDSTFGNPLLTLSTYFPGAVFDKNVIAGASASGYPADNFFPASLAGVGFVNLAGGDYHLAPSSPYKKARTDGRDIGADIDSLPGAR